jgi:hypothetical protein
MFFEVNFTKSLLNAVYAVNNPCFRLYQEFES